MILALIDDGVFFAWVLSAEADSVFYLLLSLLSPLLIHSLVCCFVYFTSHPMLALLLFDSLVHFVVSVA